MFSEICDTGQVNNSGRRSDMASDGEQSGRAARETGEDRLRRFKLDLARILQNDGPNRDELANAPVLSRWRLIVHPCDGLPALVGIVAGHPDVGPGPIVTSPVAAIDLEAGWARTVSRFYVLGVPADEALS